METVIVDETNNILDVRLNRPEKHNAMDPTMIAELTEVFKSGYGKGTKAILLSGVGGGYLLYEVHGGFQFHG